MSELDKATFHASIPPIMTGIKTGGDGMRVQFDIPETEMGEGAKLLGMRGKRLRVTVEVLTNFDNETKKQQKEAVLKWVAAGLESGEIDNLAQEFDPPFTISRQSVDYYRKSRGLDIAAIVEAGEQDALSEGLAIKGERVKRLKQLAALMERDLFGGFLWLDQVKGVGSGDVATIVEYEEFNKGEVDAYRGVLDDIAKELGHRVQRQEVTGADGGPMRVKFIDYGLDTGDDSDAD